VTRGSSNPRAQTTSHEFFAKQTDLRTSKSKTKLYWSRENVSLIDQDKNFVIQSMIEKQKQQIKDLIN
jgi:hypothetical protein